MILLDMDGVVADFVGAACAAHGRTTDGVDCWNFFEKWGITEDEFWAPINAGGREFWANLEPYPWFDELVSMVSMADPKFYLCTKPSTQADCLAGKMDWIHRHFGKHFRRYFFAPDKQWLAAPGRLLIDDSDENCNGFRNSMGGAHCFAQPWNTCSIFQDRRMDFARLDVEDHTARRLASVCS